MPDLNSAYVDDSPADAIQKGHFQQVRYLLELGHDADTRNDNKERHTSLQLCSLVEDQTWRLNIAQTLLQKGAHVGLRDCNGLNALHYACLYERADLVNIFLLAIDFNLNAGDRHGNTALFYAASGDNVDIVRCLVQVMTRYHITLNKANRKGMTPLMQAWSKDKIDIAELLQSSGADTTLKDTFNKSTFTYEGEARARDHYRKQQEANKRRWIRYNDVLGWKEQQTRLRESSPQLGWQEKLNETQRKAVVQQRDLKRLISAAHRDDLRNDPRFVFNATSAQFFESGNSLINGDSGTNCISSGSANQTAKNPIHRSKSTDLINWRHNMPRMYHDLQYQVSTSYLPTASRTLTAEQSAYLGYFNENGHFLRMVDLTAGAAEEAYDTTSNMQRFSRTGSHGSSYSKTSKDAQLNRKERRNKKGNASTSKSILSESASQNEDAMAAFLFNVTDGVSRSKKRTVSGVKARPMSRAAFNTIMSRDTPSPKVE